MKLTHFSVFYTMSVYKNVAVYMPWQFLQVKVFLENECGEEIRKQFTTQKPFRTREICVYLPITKNKQKKIYIDVKI